MSAEHMKNKIASGLVWTFASRAFAQGISFIVSIVLARLLLPSEYGVVSMIMVFISIANVLVANGLGEALVQNEDSTEEDFSTILICSTAFSVVLYMIFFVGSPFIGRFYKMDLTSMIRVLAIKIPLAAVNCIQLAYVAKHMIFKKMFWATSIGTLISGIVGISLAVGGAGPWALVAQYLISSMMDVLVLWIILPLKIHRQFSVKTAKKMLPYGWRIMLSSLINTGFTEIRALLIGKVYSSSSLAFYQKGNQFPALIINNIDTAIGKVFFPAMSAVKDDVAHLKHMARMSIRMTSFVILPLMFGLAAVGENLITLLLTEKWSDSVIFLQCACLFYAVQPIQTADWQILKASGRADLCVKLEVIKKTIAILLLVVATFFGIEAVAFSSVVSAVISAIINMIPAARIAQYSIINHLQDIMWPLVYSMFMWGVVTVVGKLLGDPLIGIIVQTISGMTVYVGIATLRKDNVFFQIVGIISTFMKRK